MWDIDEEARKAEIELALLRSRPRNNLLINILIAIFLIVCFVFSSVMASDVAITVRHKNIEGNGSIVIVPGMGEKTYILTVAHVIGGDIFESDSVNIVIDDKNIKTKVVAVCKEYDLCLLYTDEIVHRAYLNIPEKGKNLDNTPLTLYVTKEPKKFPIRLDGPEGWQWKIKGHYELGFSGGPVCILSGNYLAGMANGGFIKTMKGDVVETIDPNRGLIIPVPLIRTFLALVAEKPLSNSVLFVSKKSIDEWTPHKVPRPPVIDDVFTTPYELKGKHEN